MSDDLLPAANALAADGAATFEPLRPRLFGIAYRMLGSVSEAEDVVQDAYLRWHGVDHASVVNPTAYLVSMVTRLSIDTLRAARISRTSYIGPWLPEPLVSGLPNSDPAAMLDLADDLSMAFLLLLERLTPLERAVFLLRESFDFSYREIAAIVAKSEENCRQIARRAKKHVAEDHLAAPADPVQHDTLLAQFVAAVGDGDLQRLLTQLAHDAVVYSDGGGKVQAARRPIVGAEQVARLLIGLRQKMTDQSAVRPAQVNGRSGLITIINGQVQSVVAIDVRAGKIQQVFIVVNPAKLPPDDRPGWA